MAQAEPAGAASSAWMMNSVEPDEVGGLDHLVPALRVDQHGDAGDALADLGDRAGGEAAVHRAVALPQDHLRVAELLDGEPALRLVGVVEDAVVQRQAHLADGGVAAEVLVGQEQHLAGLLERPRQGDPGVGRRADGPAVPAGERLDRGARVHVGDGDDVVGDARLGQDVPALLDLVERRHVGHGAAGGEVGQQHGLRRPGEHVRALGHEVDAAEDDELGLRAGRGLCASLKESPVTSAKAMTSSRW